jgi:sensor histidine kinase regulating citrate/malate metabolism
MIDIVSIVSKTIEENINHEFEITFTKDEVIIQDLKIENIKVYFSEKDMKELINNVIENATRHGFINKRKDHKILFDLTIEDSSVVLKIINNGLPFPTGIVDSFGTKGIKASTTGNKGIGVWKIIQAIKHFGHKYEVINQPDNDFTAGWIFKFDLNND